MKRILTTLIAVALMLPLASMATDNAELFSYDASAVETEMADLDELESFVLNNEGVTLNLLQSEGNVLVSNVSSSPGSFLQIQEGPLGIPSILWGFCFSIPGMAVVYFVTDSKDETIKSLWGCLISAVLFGGGYWGFGF